LCLFAGILAEARLAAERPPVVAELERDALTLAGADARRLFSSARGSGE
jgi:hypothetical protein